MKKVVFVIGILLSVLSAQSQDFIGQWYGADYQEFLEITADSVSFITLWGEEFGTPECYEVETYPYELDNGQIWVEASAMNFNMICTMAHQRLYVCRVARFWLSSFWLFRYCF